MDTADPAAVALSAQSPARRQARRMHNPSAPLFASLFLLLAGGCAVGAGVSGAAVFALTAWVTLCAMWAAAGLTDYLLDRTAVA